MKHASFEPASALIAAAQRSMAKPMLVGILGSLGIAALIGLLAAYLVPAGPGAHLAAAGFALCAGSGSAFVISRILAAQMGRLAARPIELLLEQLDAGDLDRFHWSRGRALGRAQIADDLKLLQRRIRECARHSRSMIDELERAREHASQQNVARSQFLANMSHELRTPLNAILGYAMLLHEDARDAGDETTMADLDRIQQAGRNLLALINDILDFSRIESGRATVERVVIDVQALATLVASSCGANDRPNGNRFEMIIDDGVGIMIGDARKVHQCLSNLLSNAFKFTQDGSVSLRVSALRRGDTPWIEFAIRDTGIGIAPENHGQLFDPFRQVDASATRRFGGTGLGLAIVRRLAALMEGECTLESTPGEGSTFRLILPLGEPAKRMNGRSLPASSETVTDFVETPSAEHTALVIDDDEAAIDLMRRWLVRMGYNVLCSTNGDAALDLARTHEPDFILLDALLPGRSGYEVLEELRTDSVIGHVPTILITVDDDRARGLKAGATDYLRKPITEQQLREVLDVYRLRATGEILLIEDDDDSADLLTRSVAQVGFSARRALNGEEGLAMANELRPDAIVLDLAMPIMSGFEVLDRLATNELLRDVPLIVVSGCDISIEQHQRLVAAGHQFFTKAASTPREIAQSLKDLVA